MAHFDDFSPLRTHRTAMYGSFTMLEKIAKLHSPVAPLDNGRVRK